MHIAFFSDQHPATIGGLQVSLGLQRQHLEHLGHTVTVCAPDSRRTPSRLYVRDEDVLLAATQVGEHSFCLAGERADRAVDAGFARRPPVDLVHVQADVWGAWNGYRFARRHGLPVVHTMHTNVEVGLPAILPFPRAAFRLMFAAHRRYLGTGPVGDVAGYARSFAAAADLLVAPSTHFAERLRGYGIARPIHIVPTGVDDEQLAVVRRAPRTTRDRPLLLWPGRVSREKGLDDFLLALARSGADADAHIYGAGAALARSRRLAAELGLGSRVSFRGAVPHDAVLRAMHDADAVVQSSIGYETQGLTVYEAVSVGTPVLLRDRAIALDLPPGLRVIAEDESVDAFAAAIRSFAGDRRSLAHRDRTPSDAFLQSALTVDMLGHYDTVLAADALRSRGGLHRAA
jgi:glycosyltransferase involved in cell wall biosynthesis